VLLICREKASRSRLSLAREERVRREQAQSSVGWREGEREGGRSVSDCRAVDVPRKMRRDPIVAIPSLVGEGGEGAEGASAVV